MCGIAGWFGQSWTLERRCDLEKMIRAIHRRGPDARGLWLGEHAALGHARLAVIDPVGGSQPMAVRFGGREYVISFSGEIYNYRELRRTLTGLNHSFATASDTEVLLHSYIEWGADCLPRLDGMFAFAVWDSHRNRLFLARDRVGIKPLYYAPVDGGIVFGSEPKAILASGRLKARVTLTGLREVLDMVKTPGAAVFDGMFELKPGSFLVASVDGIKESCYWKLRATEHTEGPTATTEHVRELLEHVVSDQLVSDVPICSLLSGGLDSSAVSAIAARQLAPNALRTFAVDFSSAADNFSRDAVRQSPDFPYAVEAAKHIGSDHREILLNGEDLLSEHVRAEVLAATDLPPAYWGDMWPSLYLLFKQVKSGSTVAISGEGADELFGGYQWFFNPAAVRGDTFPWLTSGSSRYFGGTKLFNPDFLKDLNLPEVRAQSYLDALKQAPVLDGESVKERQMRLVSYLNLTRFMQTLLDRKDRMSMASGLEVRVPFCDHKLVEYVFNAPWSLKSADGREKSLLRAAVSDLLPTSILMRKKNPYPAIQDAGYESGLRSMLREVVTCPSSPILPLLDSSKVDAELRRNSTGVSLPYSRGSLELCVWLNEWLTRYDVQLVS